ncbi:hypothetical protein LCGC14_0737840 [marine sediment metagenome]|uniref:Uncharacterized protein n=1 Tax=marine sediment metagenome TaxID=412755 RepID=A0A0F9TEV6_9ZZZZ
MKISEIRGNLKTWVEQRNSIILKIEKLDKRTEELEKKLDKYEREEVQEK